MSTTEGNSIITRVKEFLKSKLTDTRYLDPEIYPDELNKGYYDKRWMKCKTLWILVAFYGLSTIVGSLIPNPVYAYILDIWFVDNIFKCIWGFFAHSKTVSSIAV